MRTLAVLACTLAAAAACIPTKTPEPGIPAMPPATKPCDQYGRTSEATCKHASYPANCDLGTAPSLSATAMSCSTGKNIQVVQVDAAGMVIRLNIVPSAMCVAGVWKDNTGADLFAVPPSGTITVACAQ